MPYGQQYPRAPGLLDMYGSDPRDPRRRFMPQQAGPTAAAYRAPGGAYPGAPTPPQVNYGQVDQRAPPEPSAASMRSPTDQLLAQAQAYAEAERKRRREQQLLAAQQAAAGTETPVVATGNPQAGATLWPSWLTGAFGGGGGGSGSGGG